MEEPELFASLFGRRWIDAIGAFNRTTFAVTKKGSKLS